MPDLEEQLARFASHFDRACEASMPDVPLPAVERRRVGPMMLVGVAAMTVAGLVATGLLVRPRPTDEPSATSLPSTPPISTGSTTPSTTALPPSTSVVPASGTLPFETSAALAALPALEPGWLPDDAIEGAAVGVELRSGAADGWAQIYVAPDRSGRLIVSTGGTYGGAGEGAAAQLVVELGAFVSATAEAIDHVEDVAESLNLRNGRIGWDLVVPDGYELLGEGPVSGVAFRRTWATPDLGTVQFSVHSTFQGLASPLAGDISTTTAVGNQIAVEMTIPSTISHTLTWSPAPGFLATVSATDNHADDLDRIADSIRTVSDEQWQTLISGATIESQSGETRGGDPTAPGYRDVERFLPVELPVGFDPPTPSQGWVEPGNPTAGSGWEQTWIGADELNPSVVTVTATTDPLPAGAALDINGRTGGFTDDTSTDVRTLIVDRPDGTTTTVMARRLTDDQILTVARALVARPDGNGYDISYPALGLEPLSDASDGGAPTELALGWVDGVRTITVLTEHGPPGAIIRPIAASTLRRVNVNGADALLIDGYKISWYLDDRTAATVIGQGMTTDELLAIARAARPATAREWLDAWNRVPVRNR